MSACVGSQKKIYIDFVFFLNFIFSFLRSNKPYLPAGDVASKIDEICSSEKITKNHVFQNLEEKFKILQAFNLSFQHSVPNSQLHEINSIGSINQIL